MEIIVAASKEELGLKAAAAGAARLRQAIALCDVANIIVATGASQFEMLAALVRAEEVDWSKVTAFHLDEYAGLPKTHPASFRRYLLERFVGQLPTPLANFHEISGEGDLTAECSRLGRLIASCPIDVAFIGIGENGHLAFNDPPADFSAASPYHVVALDEACRRQQWGEGWFASLDDVPRTAISMSIPQIMASRAIICSVPDERKAAAVRRALRGPVTPEVPASILQRHAAATIFLDGPSASLLS